jgi:hypothetical protein
MAWPTGEPPRITGQSVASLRSATKRRLRLPHRRVVAGLRAPDPRHVRSTGGPRAVRPWSSGTDPPRR